MPITITLDDGPDHVTKSLGHLNRILVMKGESTDDLAQDIINRQMNLTDNNRPQKSCMSIWTIFMIKIQNKLSVT